MASMRDGICIGKGRFGKGKGLILKAKPRCTCCGKPLIFVYEDAVGHINVKCDNCGNTFIIDLETLVVYPDVKEA
jgi:predicted RNA-binding Zn-ribbon protein involved in translation (DUF1610 family)